MFKRKLQHYFILAIVSIIFLSPTTGYAKISTSLLRSLISRKVLLEKNDGSEVRGIIRGLSATFVMIEKKNGRVVRVPRHLLSNIRVARRYRRDNNRDSSPPPPSNNGRYSQSDPPPRFDADYWRHQYYRARRLRNRGIGFTITGIVLLITTAALAPMSYDYDYDRNYDMGLVLAITGLTGLGFTGAGIPMWIVGQVKKGRAGRRLRRLGRSSPHLSSKTVPMPFRQKGVHTFVTSR